MKALERLVSTAAARLGYVMLPRPRLERVAAARLLAGIFYRAQIDCVLDVGANAGQFGDFLRDEVGFRGLIVSVEPLPALAARLRERAARSPPWEVRETALGAAPGRLALNVTATLGLSSFLRPDTALVPGWEGVSQVTERLDVEVSTADALIADVRRTHGVGRFYLKLDTQGFDLEAMRGLHDEEAAVHAMQTEMSVVPIYAGMPDYRTSLDTMTARGFELAGLFAVSATGDMRLIEFDAIMIRPGSTQPRAT